MIDINVNVQYLYKIKILYRQSVFDGYDSDIDEVDEESENVDDERKREEREEDNKLINEKQDLSQKDENREDGRARTLSRSQSVPVWNPSSRMVDRVYTVGCFDLFHEGHVKLLMRLKGLGRKVKNERIITSVRPFFYTHLFFPSPPLSLSLSLSLFRFSISNNSRVQLFAHFPLHFILVSI